MIWQIYLVIGFFIGWFARGIVMLIIQNKKEKSE